MLQQSIFAGSRMAAAFGGLFIALLAAACVSDVRSRRISNNLVLVLALAGTAFSLWRLSALDGAISAALGMALGLAIWISFYALGVLGAGDVKFFAAACAWLGPSLAWRAALLAAAFGGVLAVGFLLWESRLGGALRRLAVMATARSVALPSLEDMSEQQARRQLPYGVALALGLVVVAMFPSVL